MKYLKLSYSQSDLELVARYLKSGKIVCLPGDTVYGLSVRADSDQAVSALARFKGRNEKHFLILVSGWKMLEKYALYNSFQEKYLRSLWSKSRPATVILGDKRLLSKHLSAEVNRLGVRLPKNEFLIKMIELVGVPIVSTSANLSGLEPMVDPALMKKSFKDKKPHLLVDGGRVKKKLVSKLIDLRQYPEVKVLRA
jgi:L-threonylcarbamoyladenylate synthase